jgi:tRNA dimethylallyltransferase
MLAEVPMSELHAATAPPVAAEFLNIALVPSDRELLHQRIAIRLKHMIEEGFMDEMRALAQMPGVSEQSPAMRAVGYRQFWPCVRGESSLDECLEQATIATRRLAKRQLTWLRSWPKVEVVDSLSPDAGRKVNDRVEQWLKSDASETISG